MAITDWWLLGGLGFFLGGLLNMVTFDGEIHFHLLRWCVVCVVFLGGIDCNRIVSLSFFQEFDWLDNFCAFTRLRCFQWVLFVLWLSGYGFSPKVFLFSVLEEKWVGVFFMGELD